MAVRATRGKEASVNKLSKDGYKLSWGKDGYQRDCGYTAKSTDNGDIAFKQPRFYLGKNETEARQRSVQLDKVWDAVVSRWQRDHTTPRPVWDTTTLAIARAVSKGETTVRLELPPALKGNTAEEASSVSVLWLQLLQRDFPFILLTLADETTEAKGKEFWAGLADNAQAEARTATARAEDYRNLSSKSKAGATLHQALDAFVKAVEQQHQRADGQGASEYARTVGKDVQRIKEHQADIPLAGFDLPAIDNLLTYWRNRPNTKKGKPAAVDTVRNTIKRIRSFVRWLHRSSFNWRKPADYEVEPIRIKRTAAERAKIVNGVDFWTVEELTALWQAATPIVRLWILLGLNCGFAEAELSTLQKEEVRLNIAHPEFKDINGSFIFRIRGKTGVYGEWKLWKETEEAIRWYLSRRPDTKETALVVNRNGRALNTPTAGGNRNGTIPNVWGLTLDRAEKDNPNFNRLPFKYLRKTSGKFIRRIAGGEMQRVFHARGNPVENDKQASAYSDPYFVDVFNALNKFREMLSPMFASVSDPFPQEGSSKHPSTSVGTREVMQQLQDSGMKRREIAKELGVSVATVATYTANRERQEITEELQQKIKTLRSEGKTYREIATTVKVGLATVHKVLAK